MSSGFSDTPVYPHGHKESTTAWSTLRQILTGRQQETAYPMRGFPRSRGYSVAESPDRMSLAHHGHL